MVDNRLGQRIRAERKTAGLTQEELARRAGMSLKGMRGVERGRVADPHLSTLRGIASGLGITVGRLLGEGA